MNDALIKCETDLLDAYEKSYMAGNDAALAAALNDCEQRKVLLPAWLFSAVRSMIEETIEPKKVRPVGAHAKLLTRINDTLKHLYRLQAVLLAQAEAHRQGEHLPLSAAYEVAAGKIVEHLIDNENPYDVVKASYAKAKQIVQSEHERDFIGPYISASTTLGWAKAIEFFAEQAKPTK